MAFNMRQWDHIFQDTSAVLPNAADLLNNILSLTLHSK
ncbi:hypothetical protein M7I_1138 [Glarea lozoyensis 74030]|uniref:Uncharacterized protein n=1 Tax=Glarea lozoyensis (strain ATCC 74030 / MF5533) TaxID=1104152 RepID=H0EF97_GLAL7|nr:hypothetical protein M7I_1138 [Glarea lozoyensis 74030]